MKDLVGLAKSGDRKPHVRVMTEIAACKNYSDLADILLPDDEATVKELGKTHCDDSKQFVRAVFTEWLEKDDDDTSDRAPRRTWASLVESIELAGLPGVLAKSIRDTCSTYGVGELPLQYW